MTWKHVACASAFGCAVLAMQALLDRPAEVRIEVSAPPVVVAIPAPPVVVIPPAPPPPPPPPPAPPPVLEAHAGCAADVATIGIPMAQAPADLNAAQIVEVAVSREGCTLAARTASTMAVSFDGGRSFARTEMSGVTQMAAAGDRVMLFDGKSRFGTMLPGQPTVWHAIPTPVVAGRLYAAGKWTVLAGGTLAAFSDDNGDTWRYVELPEIAILGLEANGHLYGARSKALVEPDGEHIAVYQNTRYVADLAHPHWRALDTNPGTPADESGRYVLETDKFWGCGSSQKLELVAHGNATMVAGDLRDEVWPVRVHTTAGVTFASLSNQLVRIDGAAAVAGDMIGELVGVDASGTAIVNAQSQLLRWSKSGGWRVLL